MEAAEKARLINEREQRRAAQAKQLRASLRWLNLERGRWTAHTVVGEAIIAKVQNHLWVCGFAGGENWGAASLAEAKEKIALWIEKQQQG